MATFKRIKNLVTAANNGQLQWGQNMASDGSIGEFIWYSDDGNIIRFTDDPEIKSMCRLYVPEPRINVSKINGIINNKADMELTCEEIRKYKRQHLYVLDRDPNHWLAFASVHIGEFLALKQDLIFGAHLIGDKPVMAVYKVRHIESVQFWNPIAVIMGVRRC